MPPCHYIVESDLFLQCVADIIPVHSLYAARTRRSKFDLAVSAKESGADVVTDAPSEWQRSFANLLARMANTYIQRCSNDLSSATPSAGDAWPKPIRCLAPRARTNCVEMRMRAHVAVCASYAARCRVRPLPQSRQTVNGEVDREGTALRVERCSLPGMNGPSGMREGPTLIPAQVPTQGGF